MTAAFTGLAVLRAGARPVFADVDAATLNVCSDTLARAITPRTRAILPVHLYGHPCDLEPILELGRARGIPVIEDACQAHGARYRGKIVGSISGLGALSFYPTKNLGAFGDGGAVLVDDPATAARLRQLRNGGQTDRYHHETSGLNSRLDEMQAAILRVKLRHLEAANERRRELAQRYQAALAGFVELPQEQPYARTAHHLFVIRHAKRDALMTALKERGVGTLIHYPIPLHLQPAFRSLGGKRGDFPVTETAAGRVFSLPMYPELSDAQVALVCEAVRDAVRSL
jgi:dTDP-4-amino-4,6-dideoxygalactose transaminase